MIFPENRSPLFRIMLQSAPDIRQGFDKLRCFFLMIIAERLSRCGETSR
jgi:hypothetical protein